MAEHGFVTPLDLWHGGAPGRRPGDLLLPPSVTGLARNSGNLSLSAGLGQIAYQRDRVYLTSDRDLARVWAGQWTSAAGRIGYGWLYRVEVTEGDLEDDDDLLSLRGRSFQAAAAVVVSVFERAVAPNQARFARTLRHVLTDLERAKRDR